jgi:hypothetical protein
VTAAAAAAVAAVMAMPMAFAEGSFSSYMTAVYPGFSSRTWTDHNSDSQSTNIELATCFWNPQHMGLKNLTLQLTKQEPWYLPQQNRGRRNYVCPTGSTQAWGRQPSGSYHFTLVDVNGSDHSPLAVSVKTVKVWY